MKVKWYYKNGELFTEMEMGQTGFYCPVCGTLGVLISKDTDSEENQLCFCDNCNYAFYFHSPGPENMKVEK